MRGQTAGLLGCGLAVFALGCQPEAREPQRGFALAGVALETQPRPARQDPQGQLVFRRLWEGPAPNFWGASVSPDGRVVSEIDRRTGQLALLDLLTDVLKPVPDKGREDSDYAETSVFSPDGRQLAYTYGRTSGYEIRTIGVDGSGQRTIVPNLGRRFYPVLMDWSDDGRQILALLWDDGSKPPMRVGLISVVDGSIRSLKGYDEWVNSSVCVLSPDGRLVAYDVSSSPWGDHDIHLLPVDGGREVALLNGPTDDRLLGWTPDGSSVLFYSDRGLTKGIWRLRISNGRPAGAPVLLRGDVWGLEPIGFSRDAYYYGVMTEQPQLHVAIIDPQAWRLVSSPAAIEDPSLGSSGWGAWSPDGRRLAYIRSAGGKRGWKLVLRSVTGEDSREITPSRIVPGSLLRWTDDGQAVLMFGQDSSSNFGTYRLDLNTGTASVILQFASATWPQPQTTQYSSDLKTAYFARPSEVPGTGKIVARDLASGRERDIATAEYTPLLSLSPDGRTLALFYRGKTGEATRIATVPTSGGSIREVYRASGPGDSPGPRALSPSSVSWSPDGRYVLFVDLDKEANCYSLWRVPVGGGEPGRIELPFGDPPGLSRLAVHPDGNRIAFVSGQARGEIWVVEKLPGTK